MLRKKNSLNSVNPTEVLNNLKSDDETLQMWAVDQLPMMKMIGGMKENADAFEYINAIILSKDDIFHRAVQDAITRELKKRAMTSNDRSRILMPFLIKMSRSTGVSAWNDLLHDLCKTFHDPITQSLAFDQISPIFLLDRSSFGIACATAMTVGLCEAGAIMPMDLINNLVMQPIILQPFLQVFMSSLIATQSDSFVNQIFTKIVHSPISHSSLIHAAINLDIIPPILQRQITDTLRSPSHTSDIAAVIAKNCCILVAKGFTKPKTLLQIIWKSKIFNSKFYDVVANFYTSFIKEMNTNDAIMFLKKIHESKNPYSVKLAKKLIDVTANRESCDFIVNMLCSDESFVQFEDWCDTICHVMSKVNSEYATTLSENLISRCRIEIIDGHDKSINLKDIDASDNVKKPQKSTVKVTSWRRVTAMIKALSRSPCTHIICNGGFKLIREALKSQSFTLIDSIIDIVEAIKSRTDEIVKLYDEIFNGNAYSKVLFVKLVCKTLHIFKEKEIESFLFPKYSSLMISTDIPNNVQCCALRSFGCFVKLSPSFLTKLVKKEFLEKMNEVMNSQERSIIDSLKDSRNDIKKILACYKPPSNTPNKTKKKRTSTRKSILPMYNDENADPNIKIVAKPRKQRFSLMQSQQHFGSTNQRHQIIRPTVTSSFQRKSGHYIPDVDF